jgi:hypothetical protein
MRENSRVESSNRDDDGPFFELPEKAGFGRLVAGVVAPLAAGPTFAFVSPVETAPVRLRTAPEMATPDFID